MPEYRFKFKSNTKEEFNDVVYEGPPFSLTQMAYTFTILPQKTQFWRFGIRLSQTPDIPFFNPVHRHREGIIDIHLSVGEFDGEKWSLPNRLQIGQYHIANTEQIISRSDSYKPMSQVTWSIELLNGYEDQNFLVFEYKAPGVTAFKNRVVIPATHKYFQLFAWSDKNEFELDCTITEAHILRRDKGNEDSIRNYWMLKINPKSFKISEFHEGSEIWFGTHDTRFAQRQEYSLYFDVKEGDAVLGYAFDPNNEIIWDMTVDLGVHSDRNYGESIKLSINEVLDPGIPIDNFISFLPPNVDQVLTEPSPIRLVAITQEVYFSILNSSTGARRKKTCYYPSYRTEGDHKATPDQLQLEYDIEALATVIALREVSPPLAVGLFGNWGSGKSFFMEKLEHKISAYAGTGDERYVRHVVPVRFNSWHYCDTNLWASLITQIFESLKKFSKDEGQEEELSKLVETLQITSLQRDVAVETRKKLEETVGLLKLQQEKKREELQDVTGIKLLRIILNDKHFHEDLSRLKDKNIDKIVENVEEVDRYIEELNDFGNKARYFFRELLNLNGWRWFAVILFAIVILGLSLLFTKVYPEVWVKFTTWLAAVTTAVMAVAGRVRSVFKPVKENLNEAVKRLKSLKSTIEARAIIDPPELTQKQKEIEGLRNSIKKLDIKIDQTESKIKDAVTGKRLGDFIDKRSKDEQYMKGLGMISWIRKDFVTLDKLLREQYELDEEQRKAFSNPQDVKLRIDRIVLYIDDLDRCNEDVVVKVLEAIHLLLAFPLFVVIVGVDPRWLNNALNNKLGKLFSPTARARPTDNLQSWGKAATSYDYLEKIFQIPFALKPIGKTGQERLIDYLMPADLVQPANPPAIQPGNQPQSTDLNVDDQIDKDDTATTEDTADDQPGARIKLSFKTEELNFIKKLSVIFGQTPRSIKRFVNVYMIIKSHRNLVIKNSDHYKEYYPVIVLLAIVVGCSENAAQFIKKVNEARNHQLFGEFMGMTANDPNAADIKEILQKYEVLFDPEVSKLSMADFKANAELVSRFSFRQILQ